MSLKGCISLAIKNIRSYYRTSFKVIGVFTLATVCIICFFSYTLSVSIQINSMSESMSSCNFVSIDSKIPALNILEAYDFISEAKQRSNVLIDEEITSVEINNIVMKIDEVKYNGVNDYSNYFQTDFSYGADKDVYSVYFDIEAYNTDFSVFTESDLREFMSKSGKNKYINGDMINGEKQILISDYMLERFGILENNHDNFIGKKLSFYLKDTDKPIIEDYIIVGVIDSDLFHTLCNNCSSQIIISNINPELSYTNTGYVQYYTDSFRNTNKLSIMLSNDNIPHVLNQNVENYDSIEKQQSISNRLIYIVIIFLLIALSISIITVIYFYNSEKTKYTSMMLAIGLRRGKLLVIRLWEIMIDGFISMIIGAALSTVLIIMFNLYFSDEIGVYLSFDAFRIAIIGLAVLIYILILCLLVSIINFIKLKKCSVSDVLSQA